MPFGRIAAFVAALFVFAGAADGSGPHRPFQVGLWSGGAYTDDRTGAFSHCSAGVLYDGGITLFVVGTEGHGWWLGFTGPHWSPVSGAEVPVELQFDARPPVEIAATTTDGQLLLVPLPEYSRLIEAFRDASRMSVVAQGHSFSLSLAGTSSVLSELAKCVGGSIALDTAPLAAPPAPPPAGPTLPRIPKSLAARDAIEREEIRLARNFLLAAGLPNARLIDSDKPAALAKFTAVWRSDDAAGAVRIIPSGPDVTGIGIVSDLISVDPKLCKGNFAAERSSDAVDGEVVFRAALSCTESGNDRTAQYIVIPRQRDGFVVFAIIGTNGTGGPPPDRLKPDPLGRAALQAVAPGD